MCFFHKKIFDYDKKKVDTIYFLCQTEIYYLRCKSCLKLKVFQGFIVLSIKIPGFLVTVVQNSRFFGSPDVNQSFFFI